MEGHSAMAWSRITHLESRRTNMEGANHQYPEVTLVTTVVK